MSCREGEFEVSWRVSKVRHCEINLLRRIATRIRDEDDSTITCDLATCEGSNQMLIVRSIVASGRGQDMRRSIDHHESILEELSFIQNRHSVIPYLYGRNTGPKYNRFTVLCTGDIRPLKDIFTRGRAPLSILGPVVDKLVDAVCHLQNFGATWTYPIGWAVESVYLDVNGEPKIGLVDDLGAISDDPDWHADLVANAAITLLGSSTISCPQENYVVHADCMSSLWHAEMFGALVDAGYNTANRMESTVLRAAIFDLVPLTRESQRYLRQTYKNPKCVYELWGNVLFRLALGLRKRPGSCHGRAHHTRRDWR